MDKMKEENLKIAVLFSVILTWIGIGTVVFRLLKQWTWIDSFYFSVITLTTVGYGDLHPTMPYSKLFSAFYVLIGVGIMVTAIGNMGTKIISRREKKFLQKYQNDGGEK
jgi:voltage-gated potassium channel